MRAAGHEAREVRHVGEEHGIDRIGDGPKAGEVDRPRIGRAAADDELRPMLPRQARDLLHVDEAGPVDAIAHRPETICR